MKWNSVSSIKIIFHMVFTIQRCVIWRKCRTVQIHQSKTIITSDRILGKVSFQNYHNQFDFGCKRIRFSENGIYGRDFIYLFSFVSITYSCLSWKYHMKNINSTISTSLFALRKLRVLTDINTAKTAYQIRLCVDYKLNS